VTLAWVRGAGGVAAQADPSYDYCKQEYLTELGRPRRMV
jgi:hypothetical protein